VSVEQKIAEAVHEPQMPLPVRKCRRSLSFAAVTSCSFSATSDPERFAAEAAWHGIELLGPPGALPANGD
jgi:hypothetical protein